MQTLESRAKLLSLENEKISRDMKALQNELDKVKDERDEHVGAEKLAALIQQTLLEGKYNEIVSNALYCTWSWLAHYHPLFCKDCLLKKFSPHCC